MSLLKVLAGDQPALRKASEPIDKITPAIRQLAADMIDTMRDYDGVGLSAVQVGIHKRLIVLESPPLKDYPDNPVFPLYVVINPVLEPIGPATEVGTEGCLSLPRWYGPVRRHHKIRVRGQNLDGSPLDIQVKGFCARVFQHEVDHLDGVLFTDKLTDPAQLRKIEPDDAPIAE